MIMKKVVRKGHFLGFAVGMVLTVAGAAGTVCADDGIAINDANFPDPVFRAYVSTEFDTETEGKGSLSAAEISNATNLDIPSGVSSLVGIKYFSSMRSLDCSYNNLTSLDVSNCESLTSLLCNNNQLTQINVSGCNALGGFDCARNRLRTLDISSCTALTIFGCSNNQLTSLDVSHNTSLRRMECSENNLTSLDVTRNTALESLEAYSNPITLLDISSCPLLESLYFSCKEHMQSSTSQVYYTPEYWLSFDNTVTVITSKGTYPPGASSGQTEPVVAPVQTEKNTITKIPKVTGVKAEDQGPPSC